MKEGEEEEELEEGEEEELEEGQEPSRQRSTRN